MNDKELTELYHYGVLGMKWGVHRGNAANTEADTSLKHWKYVRKEMVNGKWRYYYSDSKTEYGNPSTEDIVAKYPDSPEEWSQVLEEDNEIRKENREALTNIGKRFVNWLFTGKPWNQIE